MPEPKVLPLIILTFAANLLIELLVKWENTFFRTLVSYFSEENLTIPSQ